MTNPPLPSDLIGLAEAASLLPSRKPGRKIHVTSLYRWIQRGQLEGWRIGGCWYVSRAAVLAVPQLAATTPELQSRRERLAAFERAREEIRRK